MSGRDPLSAGAPPAKPTNFKGSTKRLLTLLAADRALLGGILTLGVLSVALNVVGPKILGHATDIVFTGFFSQQLPEGASKGQAVEGLRDNGDDQVADMVAAMDVTPGEGIDFNALGWVLIGVLCVYVAASLFAWVQGRLVTLAVQRTVADMRSDVESKLGRLPLSYFDGRTRGEILSRVTNDIDNIAQSIQQTMSS